MEARRRIAPVARRNSNGNSNSNGAASNAVAGTNGRHQPQQRPTKPKLPAFLNAAMITLLCSLMGLAYISLYALTVEDGVVPNRHIQLQSNTRKNGLGPETVEFKKKQKVGNSEEVSVPKKKLPPQRKSVLEQVEKLRAEFETLYGGKEVAQAMLKRGIHTFSDSTLTMTARRMLAAAAHHRPFVMAFGGYSVTVGRGNYFNQSFPFVMERILKEPLAELGIDLIVRNAAIGGIPSFPYGWCMPHFLGPDADVISWDYGMNEGKGESVMEAYVRQGLQLPRRPLFLLLDTHRPRTQLLQRYVDLGILKDPIAVAKGEVVDSDLLTKPEAERPVGLQQWDQFGAPPGSPGRSRWHPKKKEHELIGWMIAMHFLDAVQEAQHIMETEPSWNSIAVTKEEELPQLPPVISAPPGNDESVTALLYGDGLSCRTSFLPAMDEAKTLPSVAISGFAAASEKEDMMEDRDDDLYQSGWVLDIGVGERGTKQKVERSGGLGYIDMKVALYGIPESGTIRFWLPFEGADHTTTVGNKAMDWFDNVVVCEANDRKGAEACNLDMDLQYEVGGVEAKDGIAMIDGAAMYLGFKTCVHVPIPQEAVVTRRGDVMSLGGREVTDDVRKRTLEAGSQQDVGLLLDVTVSRKNITRKTGPCCISHLVWRQH